MTLEHELGISGPWIPELNATVFGSREDPGSVWGKGNGEDEILEKELA